MSKKVCIITPGTIASNPRVVKEAEALSEAGYKVHLIYTRHVDYLINAEQEILKSHPSWNYDFLDWAGPGLFSKIVKFISGLKRRGSQLLLKKSLFSSKMAPYLINRFYYWQLNKAVLSKADLYIAHYPDSISIAAKAAKINSALFAFDAEDFHRGEDVPREVVAAIAIVEDRYLQSAAYISASSTMISKAYKDLFPGVTAVLTENMFSLKNQPLFVPLNGEPFKFFWFSQTVGPKRGLEEFISILQLTGKNNIQLTLLGNCEDDFRTLLENQWKKSGLNPKLLNFIMTLPEREIFVLAAEHHFGLGLEIPYSLNRDICLTNKIYTYILSGNYLILSNTVAQNSFHESYPNTGIIINLKNPEDSAASILNLMEEADLNISRRYNYDLGRSTLNFDLEKELLLKQIASLWDLKKY